MSDNENPPDLRDYFAGQALTEVSSLISVDIPETLNVVARLAYAIADAMLLARKTGGAS